MTRKIILFHKVLELMICNCLCTQVNQKKNEVDGRVVTGRGRRAIAHTPSLCVDIESVIFNFCQMLEFSKKKLEGESGSNERQRFFDRVPHSSSLQPCDAVDRTSSNFLLVLNFNVAGRGSVDFHVPCGRSGASAPNFHVHVTTIGIGRV